MLKAEGLQPRHGHTRLEVMEERGRGGSWGRWGFLRLLQQSHALAKGMLEEASQAESSPHVSKGHE